MFRDKNTLQDVTPPKRSIQDIPIPENKNKGTAKNKSEDKKSSGFFGSTGGKKTKKLKKKLWLFAGLLVLFLVLFFALMSSSAVLTITPKQLTQRVDSNFIAVSEKEKGGIPFDIITLDEVGSKEVQSTKEESVKEKASGQIMVFNNFDKNSQRLIKNTRFETLEGLIFRIQSSVVVPGQTVDSNGKTVPGSIEVTVYADQPGEEYNIGLSDFTIPGFKGSDRFDGFYARSKTVMAGGFEGVKKIASEGDLVNAQAEISQELGEKLSQEILTKIPESFLLYEDGLFVRSSFVGTSDSEDVSSGKVAVKEKVSVYAVIFDKENLSKQIAEGTLTTKDYQGEEILITNLEDLQFEIKNKDEAEPWLEGRFVFSLKGEAKFEWIYDEEKLKNDLVGQPESETNNIFVNYKAIKSFEVKITPFWKNSFPRTTSKMQVIKKIEEN